MATEVLLPGPPLAVGVWAASKAGALRSGAHWLRMPQRHCWAKPTGLIDPRRLRKIRYVVRLK